MVKLKKQIVASAALGLFALCASPAAFGVAELMISDGTTTVTVKDNAVGDDSPATGFISYTGIGVFTGWNVVLNTDLTKPLSGTAASPSLDVNWSATHTSGSSNLTMWFSDTDFTGPIPTSAFLAGHGGSLTGTLAFTTYLDNTNVAFGTGTLLTSSVYMDGQSGIATSPTVFTVSPYSLTEKLTLTPGAVIPGDNSGDASLMPAADGGYTSALLGIAILGVAAVRRKVLPA